jgi:guanosine-3',5'-bis(diphosphate) 3'-pyrophosphohydrolase
MKQILDKVIAFADAAHGEQLRKYSKERYIVHPVKVMEICKTVTSDISTLAAAVLHDVLEDTPVTREEIFTFLLTVLPEQQATHTLQLVIDLTDVYIKKDFPALNRRQRKEREFERLSQAHPHAQTVKYADIVDNSLNITEHDADFGRVYLKEAQRMLEKMNGGDRQLYLRAVETVRQCQAQVNAFKES